MDIFVIVLSSLSLLTIVATLASVIYFNMKKHYGSDENSFNSYIKISEKIDSNSKDLDRRIVESVQGAVNNTLLQTVNTSLGTITNNINEKLSSLEQKVSKNISEGYQNTSTTFNEISNKMETLKDTIHKVEDLNGSVISLQKVLSNNQTRGQFGERILENILYDVFGDTKDLYELQKNVEYGDKKIKPDVIIHMPEYDIYVDSKYTFSNYKDLIEENLAISLIEQDTKKEFLRKAKPFIDDVKKHIKKISDDYVIPGKTAEQAIMFIPNDGIYTFIQSKLYDELVVYASKNKVVITSPSTLQAILYTLTSLRLNYYRIKNGQSILDVLASLNKSFESLKGDWAKMSKNIENLSSQKIDVDRKLNTFSRTFKKCTEGQLEKDIPEEELLV